MASISLDQRSLDAFDRLTQALENADTDGEGSSTPSYGGAPGTLKAQGTTAGQRFNNMAENIGKRMEASAGKMGDALIGAAKAVNSGSGGVEKSFGVVTAAGGALNGAFSVLSQTFVGNSQIMETFEKRAQQAGTAAHRLKTAFNVARIALGLLTAGLTAIVKSFSLTYDSFNTMADAGATFGSQLLEMKRIANQTGLGLEDFAKVVAKNVKQMTILGGSASAGAKQVAAVGTIIRETGLDKTLMAMGYTTQQQLEVASDYMRVVQMTGMLQTTSTRDLAYQSTLYAKQLKLMGELTGQSVEEMQKEREETRANAAFRAKLQELGPAVAANYEAIVNEAAKFGPAAKQAAMEVLATGGVATEAGATFAALMPSVMGMVSDMESAAHSKPMEEFPMAIAGITKGYSDALAADINNNAGLATATAFSTDGPLGLIADNYAKIVDKHQAIVALDVEKLQALSDGLGIGDHAMQTNIEAMKALKEAMVDLKNTMTNVMETLAPEFAKLATMASRLVDSLGAGGVLAAIAAFGAALIGLKTFITTRMMMGSLPGGRGMPGGGRGGFFSGLSNIFKGGGALGKFGGIAKLVGKTALRVSPLGLLLMAGDLVSGGSAALDTFKRGGSLGDIASAGGQGFLQSLSGGLYEADTPEDIVENTKTPTSTPTPVAETATAGLNMSSMTMEEIGREQIRVLKSLLSVNEQILQEI